MQTMMANAAEGKLLYSVDFHIIALLTMSSLNLKHNAAFIVSLEQFQNGFLNVSITYGYISHLIQ